MKRIALAIIFAAAGSTMAQAIETITYTYDARGRVIKVVHSGSANNGVVANYIYDKEQNRFTFNVTGAP